MREGGIVGVRKGASAGFRDKVLSLKSENGYVCGYILFGFLCILNSL